MTIEQLISDSRCFGVHPIRVESLPEDNSDLSFIGSFPEYLQVAKVAGTVILLVSTIDLSEDLFLYQEEQGDEDEEEIENNEAVEQEPYDLCVIEPKLLPFKEKIGSIGCFQLSIPVASRNIRFEISEKWWDEFLELWSEARQTIRDKCTAETQELIEEDEKNAELILERLRFLIDDEKFANLRTQRAMYEFALHRIPELTDIDAGIIKEEIRTINARIEARGIRRK